MTDALDGLLGRPPKYDAAPRSTDARAAAELEDALERMSDSFYAYDRAWRFVRLNHAARAALAANGCDPDAVLGQVLWDVLPSLRGTEYERAMRRAMDEGVSCRFEAPVTPSAARPRWLEVQVYPTATGVAAYSHDVTARHRALETQTFLSQVGEAIAGSLDFETTVRLVASLGVPTLADYAVVDLLGDDGTVRRVATAHVGLARAPLLAQTCAAVPQLDSVNLVARVLRAGAPVIGETPDDVARALGDRTLGALVARLGPRFHCCVPMVARGRTLGSLLLVRTRDGGRPRFADDDVTLADVLAKRAALALDNARLYGVAQAARARTERLQQVTAALAGAAQDGEVADAVLSAAAATLGAQSGLVFRVVAGWSARGGPLLELVGAVGLPADARARLARLPLGGHAPLARVVRAGEPAYLEHQADTAARFPDAAGPRFAGEAWTAQPLRASTGEPLGALVFGFDTPHPFPAEERQFVEAIAGQCAQALERVRLLDAERRSRAEAEAARARAEDASRAKSEFLAVMSHELRTPLNAIAGYTELLDIGVHGPLPAAAHTAVARIQRNQRHLLGLIDQLLHFARVDSGRLELTIEAVPLGAALAEVEAEMAPQLRDRGVAFEVVPPPDDVAVRADRERLRQIVRHLLANAAQFTERGGHVRVEAEPRGAEVVVRVSDTGVGIPADKLDTIFEPFVQVDASLTRTRSGTGLGLAIARRLARGMGGDVTVASALGVGTTFYVRLPR